MAVLTKNRKKLSQEYDNVKFYSLEDAVTLIKRFSFAKFDESVDVAVALGVDPRKSNQMVRGVVALPHGTGKKIRLLALCAEDVVPSALEAGADFAGLDEYISKLEKGWLDIDVIVTTPDCMAKISKVARIIGPRGLMPNPKSGTVTSDLPKSIAEIKAGKVDFKMDKGANIHLSVGKVSFPVPSLVDNCLAAIQSIYKLKPAASKGVYLQSMTLSSTMGLGLKIDLKSIGKFV